MITTNYIHQGFAATDPSKGNGAKRMMKLLEPQLKPGGCCSSRSGFSASIFINLCEVRGLPYNLQARPGLGYYVEIPKENK